MSHSASWPDRVLLGKSLSPDPRPCGNWDPICRCPSHRHSQSHHETSIEGIPACLQFFLLSPNATGRQFGCGKLSQRERQAFAYTALRTYHRCSSYRTSRPLRKVANASPPQQASHKGSPSREMVNLPKGKVCISSGPLRSTLRQRTPARGRSSL